MKDLKLVKLDNRRMGDFERLHSGREFGGCYCAVWRNADDKEAWVERCKTRPQDNLADTHRRVRVGDHVGYLATRDTDGAVVGWIGSGPKSSFNTAKWWPGSGMGPQDDSVWCIGCLAVPFQYRGLGVARRMVELFVEEARKAGAASIEAFPKDPADDDSAWCGIRRVYEELGFSVVEEKTVTETVPPPPEEPEKAPVEPPHAAEAEEPAAGQPQPEAAEEPAQEPVPRPPSENEPQPTEEQAQESVPRPPSDNEPAPVSESSVDPAAGASELPEPAPAPEPEPEPAPEPEPEKAPVEPSPRVVEKKILRMEKKLA